MDIRIEVHSEDGRAVVAVDGAIDLQTRGRLLEQARAALAASPAETATDLVLDLSGVNFIDSTGIGALVELGHDAADASGALVIRDPAPRVERILSLTGLTDAWQTEYTS